MQGVNADGLILVMSADLAISDKQLKRGPFVVLCVYVHVYVYVYVYVYV